MGYNYIRNLKDYKMGFTKEIQRNITIKNDGAKEVQTVTITFEDGVEVGRANYRNVVDYDADVPADITAFIEAKKGNQPKKPK